MALVIPDEGEVQLLTKALKSALTVDEDYSLRLYTAISPALGESTTLADFTQATFTGYAAKTLTRAGWGAPSTSVGTTSSTYAQQTWTHSGSAGSSQTILGYYVVGVTSGKVLWAETFTTARVIDGGDTLSLTPSFQFA